MDANSVIEAYRIGAWGPLASRYRIVMVDKCIEETQTGHQRRRPEETIDQAALVASLHEPHADDPVAIMSLQLSPGGSLLDAGEMALWAHALTRTDDWLICGADTASMRFGYQRQKRRHLVNLGSLLADIGHRPDPALRRNYEKAWLDALVHRLVMGLLCAWGWRSVIRGMDRYRRHDNLSAYSITTFVGQGEPSLDRAFSASRARISSRVTGRKPKQSTPTSVLVAVPGRLPCEWP